MLPLARICSVLRSSKLCCFLSPLLSTDCRISRCSKSTFPVLGGELLHCLPCLVPTSHVPHRSCCSELCSFLDIDGVRGDITTNKAVRAFVAFEGRTKATKEDLERIAPLVLNHR